MFSQSKPKQIETLEHDLESIKAAADTQLVSLQLTKELLKANTSILKDSLNQQRILVRASIDTLFSGLKFGDSALVNSVIHKEAKLMSTFLGRDGIPLLHTESIQKFLDAIGTPHKELWNEIISNVTITVDGNLAQAWMDYSFYLDETFSHCGVNAIQFFNDGDSWKIIQIIDTRRKNNCK